MEKIQKNTSLIIAWLLVGIGLLSIIIYVILLFNEGIAKIDGNIDLQGFAEFGNFVGGFVGSIWSLAAILFIYRTYRLQKIELKALGEYNRTQEFQTNFYQLIELNNRAKQEFIFANKLGSKGFSAFRAKLNEIISAKSDSEEKRKKVVLLFRNAADGYSTYPIHLLFETIKLIDNQNLQDKQRYYRIFGSTFSINERIYIYNEIHSGYLTQSEIPVNLNKVIWIIDRWKLFEFEGKEIKFTDKEMI